MSYEVRRAAGLIFLLWIWKIMLKIYNCMRTVLWMIRGTRNRIRQNQNPERYHESAQVLEVWARFKADELGQSASVDDFLLSHSGFMDPDVILFDPCVTLYNITDSEVIFVQSDRGVDATGEGFACVGQYRLAKRVIIVPMSAFLNASQKIAMPKNIVFLANTARCGSTLMVKFFQEVPECAAYGEPEVLNTLAVMYAAMNEEGRIRKTSQPLSDQRLGLFENTAPEDQLERLTSAVLAFMCKAEGKEHLVIKVRAPSVILLPFLHQRFPSSKFLFMYRDLVASTRSIYKAAAMVPALRMAWVIAIVSGTLARMFFSRVSGTILPLDDFYRPGVSLLVRSSLMWVLSAQVYCGMYNQGFPIRAFKYEHWMAKPEENTFKLLRYLELPEDWLKYISSAMEEDSQKGTCINRESVARIRVPDMDQSSEELLNAHCRRANVPGLDDPHDFPGTITS